MEDLEVVITDAGPMSKADFDHFIEIFIQCIWGDKKEEQASRR